MEPQTLALRITDLSYIYREEWSRSRRQALCGLTLDVKEGESFGFLGHNGAGKTTCIKCMLGLLQPGQGEIFIRGVSSRDPLSRRSVGYLPEQPYFYDNLSVQELMELYAALADVPRNERAVRIKEVLDLVKVSRRSKSPMRSLSKGLTQRVAMAQAIVGRPKLLILDEPFSGLDPIGRREFREILCKLKEARTSIFMCSHVLGDVEFLCDRAAILAHGTLKGVFDLKRLPEYASGRFELVVRNGPAAQEALRPFLAKGDAADKFLRLSFSAREEAEQALRAALGAHAAVESFEFVHGGLEELFVKLVEYDEAGGR